MISSDSQPDPWRCKADGHWKRREGFSERVVEGKKGVHCGWTGFGSLERREWDIPSTVSRLGKGQEIQIMYGALRECGQVRHQKITENSNNSNYYY